MYLILNIFLKNYHDNKEIFNLSSEEIEDILLSGWLKEDTEAAIDFLQSSKTRFRRSSFNPSLLKKLLVIQAYSKPRKRPSRPIYQRPTVSRVQTNRPIKTEYVPVMSGSNQLRDEEADSRKTRQSSSEMDNTLFMVLGKMMNGGSYSQEMLIKEN